MTTTPTSEAIDYSGGNGQGGGRVVRGEGSHVNSAPVVVNTEYRPHGKTRLHGETYDENQREKDCVLQVENDNLKVYQNSYTGEEPCKSGQGKTKISNGIKSP